MEEFQFCGLCGERFRAEDDPEAYVGSDERGEFALPNDPANGTMGDSVVAHAQCGLDRGLEIA